VKHLTNIRGVLGSNFRQDKGHYEIFRDLSLALKANAIIVAQVGHYRFLTNSIQFIIPLSAEYSLLASDIVKWSLLFLSPSLAFFFGKLEIIDC
jgi:hypothetical protein